MQQIPGYDWDPEKNRYFKRTPGQRPTKRPRLEHDRLPSPKQEPARRRRTQISKSLERTHQDQECVALASSSRQTTDLQLPLGEDAHCLCFDGERLLVSGTRGSLIYFTNRSLDSFGLRYFYPPVALTLLATDSCLVTSDRARVALRRKHDPFDPIQQWSIPNWTVAWYGKRLAIGKDDCVELKPSPLEAPQSSYYRTKTAVFSFCQHDQQLLAGTRNGTIFSIDHRKARPSVAATCSSSVNHLRMVSDQLLLVSCVDGTLCLKDARYLSHPEPVVRFQGLQNQYRLDLGLTTHKDEMLAAAGQNGTVQIWSLQTGDLFASERGLAADRFAEPVRAMSFDPLARCPSLFVASGACIFNYTVPY